MQSNYTRREWLKRTSALAAGALLTRRPPLNALPASRSDYHPVLSVEAHIWIQHLEQEKKTFAEGVEDMLATFQRAGYRNVELSDGFLGPDLREKTLGLLSKLSLEMPTFFASSTLHEPEAAEKSIRQILDLARATKRAGVRGIVTNPSPKANQEHKSDVELALQAQNLNRLGAELQVLGIRLMIHHQTPELLDKGREWRHQLQHTDPKFVGCCVDVQRAYRNGEEPLAFIREIRDRLECLHLRNSKDGVGMEDLADGDIDYREIAGYLQEVGYRGYLVVELAYEKETKVTRSLEENLRLSRLYAEQVFQLA
jgi:inosose dehydratase